MIPLLFTLRYLMAECWPSSQFIGTWERMNRDGDIVCKESSNNTVKPKWAQVLFNYNVKEKKYVLWLWHPLVDNIVDKL